MKQNNSVKYIYITGGVVSSLGKGIAAASIGALLEGHGYKINIIKIDPYLNYDPGTQSPLCHGEVFVTDDGAETDLDIGHYERFTNAKIARINNFTSGQVFYDVVERERAGGYIGKTVQFIPHITDEIKSRILKVGQQDLDFVIVEVGGTIGDIESAVHIEAIRQMRHDVGKENTLYIHLALAPLIRVAGEVKTKPVQQSVKDLRHLGIQPDIILVRSENELEKSAIDKIAMFCNVDADCVFQSLDVSDIYHVPTMFAKQYLDSAILNFFKMRPTRQHDTYLQKWHDLQNKQYDGEVNVAVVGKYTDVPDAYKSINESLKHAGFANNVKVNIHTIDSEKLENEDTDELLSTCDAVLVPGGFGDRGIEGKIKAAKYARENYIPYLGICLGMQVAVIEFARNVCGFSDANSTEFNPQTTNPVIDLMSSQKENTKLGGTMRLGAYDCDLTKGSLAYNDYNCDRISERHRHRYEFNNNYINYFEKKGMVISGRNPDTSLVEIVELKDNCWFVGCQFHPEFKSKPLNPHPLFVGFIRAAMMNSPEKAI